MSLLELLAILLVIAVAIATFAGDAHFPWLRSVARLLSGRNGLSLPNGRFLSYGALAGVVWILAGAGWLIATPGPAKLLALAFVALGAWRVRDGFREGPWDQRMQTLMASRKNRISSEAAAGLTVEEEQARRARLWEQAPSSLPAACQLQRAIQDELEALDDILGYMARETPDDKDGIQSITEYRRGVEQELNRVAGLIGPLRT